MRRTSLVAGVLVVQLTIVGTMILNGMRPLWYGRSVTCLAHGIDPRDLMRGDYVELAYDFNELSLSDSTIDRDIDLPASFHYGDRLYVTYNESDTGVVVTGVFANQPQRTRNFLKATVQGRSHIEKDDSAKGWATIRVRYGIEEYYTDSRTAQVVEESIRNGRRLFVRTKVLDDGTMRIAALEMSRATSNRQGQ